MTRADLGAVYAGVKAVRGGSGRTPIAPEILFALWLCATVDGVRSARATARLCRDHDAYRWICGGVQVNHPTLSDFRTGHGEALDGLLTDSVAAPLAAKAVKLKRVAQDGTRVRAGAGAASFRRRGTLDQRLEDARGQVAALKAEIDADRSGPEAGGRRKSKRRWPGCRNWKRPRSGKARNRKRPVPPPPTTRPR